MCKLYFIYKLDPSEYIMAIILKSNEKIMPLSKLQPIIKLYMVPFTNRIYQESKKGNQQGH